MFYSVHFRRLNVNRGNVICQLSQRVLLLLVFFVMQR
jgi:hypothetical protein